LKIARGLSDLFNFLAVLDDSELPRRGRHEQSAMVMGLPQVLGCPRHQGILAFVFDPGERVAWI
jgi:hypothetical protein